MVLSPASVGVVVVPVLLHLMLLLLLQVLLSKFFRALLKQQVEPGRTRVAEARQAPLYQFGGLLRI